MGTHRHVTLIAEERSQLEQLVRTGQSAARTQTRARILLLCDRSQGEKRMDTAVAEAALCSVTTVRNIRRKYLDDGLNAAIKDKGWPGAPPKFTGETEAQLTMLACSTPPAGHAQWTLRLLANQLIELGYVDYISHVTVGELLKKTSSSRGR
jgi:hypothetical protein